MSGGALPPAVLGVISQMTIRASRGGRLLVAAALAWLGLALCAQAAHATYGKVTIVKVNQGGDQNDAFTFHPSVTPSQQDFSIKAGDANEKTFTVECNVDRPGLSCSQWNYPKLTVSELSKPGYVLKSISCVHAQGSNTFPSEPNANSPPDDDTTVSGATIDLKVSFWEWVKCYVTNVPDHPAVAIDKTGPATATAGDLLTYSLEVTNPGDVSFAEQLVVVADPLCQAPPALQATNGDASPSTFDPGDHWTYTCQVQTQAGQTSVNNTATVTGTDSIGRTVSAQDTFPTTLSQPPAPAQASSPPPQPQIKVSPARVRPGSAKLRGPTGCPTKAASATITGRRIVKVTFYVDGKKVKTLTKANASGGRWVLPLNVRRFAYGTHRVQARIQFARTSETSAKTLRLSFNRCKPSIVKPNFTG
jgi:uncharacterized repeat protein (TIGR01451 family)